MARQMLAPGGSTAPRAMLTIRRRSRNYLTTRSEIAFHHRVLNKADWFPGWMLARRAKPHYF